MLSRAIIMQIHRERKVFCLRRLLGCIRRADTDFSLIQTGDRILVGLSGGKDSLVLLKALSLYRRFCPNPFTLFAAHLCLGLGKEDVAGMQRFCQEADVPLEIVPTQIGDIVLNRRQEKNPCSLCATMRRGALIDAAKRANCNKIALGHHADDAIETLLMGIFQEGRLHTFAPTTYLNRRDITFIRPMVYCSEQQVSQLAHRQQFPICKSPCPLDGNTKREYYKQLLNRLEEEIPQARQCLLAALANTAQYRLWDETSIVRKSQP